ADREHPLAFGIDSDDDVAMRAHADADVVAAVGDRPVRGAAHAAQQVARLDRPLADIVGDERSGKRRIVARSDRLIDIGMVSDMTAEAVVAEPALAHHPRDEGRGPRTPPPRADTGRSLPRSAPPL